MYSSITLSTLVYVNDFVRILTSDISREQTFEGYYSNCSQILISFEDLQ